MVRDRHFRVVAARRLTSVLAVLASLCIALALGACGSSTPAPSASTATRASTPAPSVEAKTPAVPTRSSAEPPAPGTSLAPKASAKAPGAGTVPAPRIPAKARAVLEGFVTCMRKHGIHFPSLNLSGRGRAVRPSDLNRNSPKYKAALLVCSRSLGAGLKGLGIGAGQTQSG